MKQQRDQFTLVCKITYFTRKCKGFHRFLRQQNYTVRKIKKTQHKRITRSGNITNAGMPRTAALGRIAYSPTVAMVDLVDRNLII